MSIGIFRRLVMILAPEEFKKDMLKDVKGWVRRQEKAF